MSKPFTTLIVDDSASLRERIQELLRKIAAPDSILTASNYDEATDLLHRGLPDIVILDLHFPGGSGLQLLPIIKKFYPHCCVIIFTNSTDPLYKNCCLRYGADHFLDKSMEIARLAEIVGKLYEAAHR